MHKVVVNNKYTYETDLDVNPGDIVLCPPGMSGSTFEGVVTHLSSYYEGPCKRLRRVVRTDDPLAPFSWKIDSRYYHIGNVRVSREYKEDGDRYTFIGLGNGGYTVTLWGVSDVLEFAGFRAGEYHGLTKLESDPSVAVWRSVYAGAWEYHISRAFVPGQSVGFKLVHRSCSLASMIERHLAGDPCEPMILDLFQDFLCGVLTSY